MTISEALKISAAKNTSIYRKDKYPRAEGIVISTNTKHGCIFIWRYQGYSKIILKWSPCASDLLSDQWEVYEVLDGGSAESSIKRRDKHE